MTLCCQQFINYTSSECFKVLNLFRWNYKCCSAPDTCYHDCHYSPYINDYDDPMDYTVQDG